MKMTFDIPDSQMAEIRKEMEEEIKEAVTIETVHDVLADPDKMSFSEIIKHSYGQRILDMKYKTIDELSNDDKLLLMSYWMFQLGYEY